MTSAEKRFKKSEVRRIRNKAIKTRCKTRVKQFMQAIQNKDQKAAEEQYIVLQKEFDSAHSKGVLKRNTVARKKSRMAKLYNKTFVSNAAASIAE